jgi:hypothetical protein
MTRKEAGLKVRMKGLAVLGGIITGLIPQVIYDLTHQFSQLGLFLVWVGYRIVGFMGWNEHRLSGEGMVSWWQRVSEYGVKFLAPGVPLLAGFMGVLMVLGMVVMGVRKKKNWSHENWLVMWLVVMMLGFVVHSGPSEAYFPVLFVPVGLFVGYLVKELRPGWQKMGMILILGLVMVNVEYLKRLDYLMNTSHAKENGLVVGYGPTLEVQNRIVSWLVEKADGRNIILESRGPGAEFESYLDNYRFLLKSRGYSPIANESVWFIFLFGDEKRLNFLNGVTYEIEGMRLVFLEE